MIEIRTYSSENRTINQVPGSWWIGESFEFGVFPGGEPWVKFNPDLDDIKELQRADLGLLLTARVRTMQDLAWLWQVNDILRNGYHVDKISLFIPYFPGARQDRRTATNGNVDAPFTAKMYADAINHMGFYKVFVLDPHSHVTTALINNVVELLPETAMEHIVEDRDLADRYDGLVAPDAGAAKKVERIAAHFGIEHVIYGSKKRDHVTGKLSGFGFDRSDFALPPRDGARYLMVDDICDGGGTFVGLAEFIQRFHPCEMDLWVTHGIFSGSARHTLPTVFGDVFTTNSRGPIDVADNFWAVPVHNYNKEIERVIL